MALAVGVAACGGGSSVPGPPPPSVGVVQNRPVPDVPLVDERGQPTSLAAFRGKVVIMAYFLALCQETCPLTTGAFISSSTPSRLPDWPTKSRSWRSPWIRTGTAPLASPPMHSSSVPPGPF